MTVECDHAEQVSNPHWHYALTIQSHITHHSPLNLPWGAKSIHTHTQTDTLHTLECSPNTQLLAYMSPFVVTSKPFSFFETHTPLAEQIIPRGGPVNNTTPPRPQTKNARANCYAIWTNLAGHPSPSPPLPPLLSSPPMAPLVARDAAV